MKKKIKKKFTRYVSILKIISSDSMLQLFLLIIYVFSLLDFF